MIAPRRTHLLLTVWLHYEIALYFITLADSPRVPLFVGALLLAVSNTWAARYVSSYSRVSRRFLTLLLTSAANAVVFFFLVLSLFASKREWWVAPGRAFTEAEYLWLSARVSAIVCALVVAIRIVLLCVGTAVERIDSRYGAALKETAEDRADEEQRSETLLGNEKD